MHCLSIGELEHKILHKLTVELHANYKMKFVCLWFYAFNSNSIPLTMLKDDCHSIF